MAQIGALDTPWSRRLVKLHAGERLGVVGLDAVVALLRVSDEQNWSIAGVFPGDEGGLRVEWRHGREQTLVEVDEAGLIYAAHFDFASGTEVDLENAGAAEAVTFLSDHIHA